jgi:hypothetical protein
VDWVALGGSLGAAVPDPSLADFRWDVGGHLAGTLEATAGRGPWSLGLRGGRWTTRQATGIPGSERSPRVALTQIEMVLGLRLAHPAGFALRALGGLGRVHLGYSPDRWTLTGAGLSEPLEVRFRPADEWVGSVGVAVDRDLSRDLRLGLEVDRSFFALDTAHRRGDLIVTERDAFGAWSLRMKASWILRSP